MKDEDRLIEIMAELLAEVHEMRKGVDTSNVRLEKLEKQMMLNNKAIGELRLSVMRLAEKDVYFKDYDRRIRKIEMTLAKNKLF